MSRHICSHLSVERDMVALHMGGRTDEKDSADTGRALPPQC